MTAHDNQPRHTAKCPLGGVTSRPRLKRIGVNIASMDSTNDRQSQPAPKQYRGKAVRHDQLSTMVPTLNDSKVVRRQNLVRILGFR
jgi:hypothetical protein